MTDNILSDIIRTSNDIVVECKYGKGIRFIRRRKAKQRRQLLLDDLDKLLKDNTTLPVKILSEYASILSTKYPPFGQYSHCRSAACNDSFTSIVFECDITDNDNVVVSIQTTNLEKTQCLINYSYLMNHNPRMSFTDSGITILNYDSGSSYNLHSLSELGSTIRNASAKCIIDDIYNYMKSEIYKEEL